MMPEQDQQARTGGSFRIEDWEALPSLNELRRGDTRVAIEPKAMALLEFLARRAGQVVSREELLAVIWPGVVVGDDTLTQAVVKLRKALGDHAKNASYIQTISKRGYRLIAPVALGRNSGTAPETSGGRRWRASRLAVSAAALVAVVAAWHFAIREHPDQQEAPAASGLAHGEQRPTLSILPFTALGNSEEQAHLTQGLTLDLVTDLSKLSGLWVIGSRSILGQGADGPERVQARYRVSGDVLHTREEIRIHVRLFDAETNLQIWSERYNRPFRDLFAVQEEISRQIAAALTLKVSETERLRLAQRYTRNLDAYREFLRGQALLLVRRHPENSQARAAYRRALSLDPTFARAYAGLALTFAADYRNQWVEDGAGALDKAREMARSGMQIDPGIPEVYWVLAYVSTQERKHEEALALLETAIRLDQSFADAYALMGGINTYVGRPKATVDLLRTAIRLNPDAGYLYFLLLGRAFYFIGDWEQARINLGEALARNPANLEAHVYLAATAEAAGDHEDAAWEAEEIRALDPEYSARAWLETYPMVDRPQQERLLSALVALGL